MLVSPPQENFIFPVQFYGHSLTSSLLPYSMLSRADSCSRANQLSGIIVKIKRAEPRIGIIISGECSMFSNCITQLKSTALIALLICNDKA